MQLQNVVGKTDQRPLALDFSQAAQEELAKPAGLFDLAEDRLHDRFACRILPAPPWFEACASCARPASHCAVTVRASMAGGIRHAFACRSRYRLRSGLPTDR